MSLFSDRLPEGRDLQLMYTSIGGHCTLTHDAMNIFGHEEKEPSIGCENNHLGGASKLLGYCFLFGKAYDLRAEASWTTYSDPAPYPSTSPA